jgi:hypothetical protein
VLSVGISVDRQAVRSEPGGAHDRDTGQSGEYLAIGIDEQMLEVNLHRGDVGLQSLVPRKITAQSLSPPLGIVRRGQAGPPPLRPILSIRVAEPTRGPRLQRSHGRCSTRKRDRAGQHGLPRGLLEGQAASVPGRCRQARR